MLTESICASMFLGFHHAFQQSFHYSMEQQSRRTSTQNPNPRNQVRDPSLVNSVLFHGLWKARPVCSDGIIFRRRLTGANASTHEMSKIGNPLRLREALKAGSIFAWMPITMVLCDTGRQVQVQARPRASFRTVKKCLVCGLCFFVDDSEQQGRKRGTECVGQTITGVMLCKNTKVQQRPTILHETESAVATHLQIGLIAQPLPCFHEQGRVHQNNRRVVRIKVRRNNS